MMHILLIVLLSFCFGISQKLADLFDEHGWKSSRLVSFAAGTIWGVLGSLLVLMDIYAALVVTATVLYWLLRHKLDYFNHTFAATIVLLVSIYSFGKHQELFSYLLAFFIWYAVTGTASSYLRSRHPKNKLLRLRLWIYIGPLFMSYILHNNTPFIVVVFGMLGTELMTYRSTSDNKFETSQ
jgi:hypothetical protein